MDELLCDPQHKTCGSPKVDEVREKLIEAIPDMIWTAGDGRQRGETYERMLDRASRRTGIPFNRLRDYWYRRVRKPLAEEYIVLRHWAALKADAETNRLMAEHGRLKRDAEDARSNTDLGAGNLQLSGRSLFGDLPVVL